MVEAMPNGLVAGLKISACERTLSIEMERKAGSRRTYDDDPRESGDGERVRDRELFEGERELSLRWAGAHEIDDSREAAFEACGTIGSRRRIPCQ